MEVVKGLFCISLMTGALEELYNMPMIPGVKSKGIQCGPMFVPLAVTPWTGSTAF